LQPIIVSNFTKARDKNTSYKLLKLNRLITIQLQLINENSTYIYIIMVKL